MLSPRSLSPERVLLAAAKDAFARLLCLLKVCKRCRCPEYVQWWMDVGIFNGHGYSVSPVGIAFHFDFWYRVLGLESVP